LLVQIFYCGFYVENKTEKKTYKVILATTLVLLLYYYCTKTNSRKVLQSLVMLKGGGYNYEKRMQQPSFSINQLVIFFIVRKIGFKTLANIWFIARSIQIIIAKK
jgi:hypothetical protein